jgi:hypothetical protein
MFGSGKPAMTASNRDQRLVPAGLKRSRVTENSNPFVTVSLTSIRDPLVAAYWRSWVSGCQ